MQINLKKRYLFFFLTIFAVFFSSLGILNTTSNSSSQKIEENRINPSIDNYDKNSNSLVDDIENSAYSAKETDSIYLDFPDDVLKLTGIIIANDKTIALVSYKNISGQIVEGDRGGNTTSFLPDNVILENIDINKSRLILSYRNRKFIQYLYPQSTIEINK